MRRTGDRRVDEVPRLPAAGPMALLGTDTEPTMIALAPFAVLYVVSSYALCRRFVPGMAIWLTAAAALSPWALVTLTYNLDFPAVAIGLAALALFIHGAD